MANGSPLHKRLLGRQLQQLRTALVPSVGLDEAGREIARDGRAVRRFENGDTLPDELQLRTMCKLYGADDEMLEQLRSLLEFAKQPVWWADLGPRPPATSALLAMEEMAHKICQYDWFALPGLLQTPAYARAVIESIDEDSARDRIEFDVQLRVERQAKIWESGGAPEAIFLIDENALHRMPGTGDTNRAQLARLLAPPSSATVQIVPFAAGLHSSLGMYQILDIDFESASMAAVFVEGSTTQQGLILEADEDVSRHKLAFERTRAKALSVEESARLIKEKVKGIKDD